MTHDLPTDAAVSRSAIEDLTQHPVEDVSVYRRALTHRSLLRGRDDSHLYSNERLEFLGDALLGLLVGEALYRAFPDEDEGFLTRLRAKLVSKKALAGYAREMGLGPHLLMTKNAARGQGRDNPSILSDAFEALLGAVYLDQGFEAARGFVQYRVLDTVDLDELAAAEENFKSLLQEHLQGQNRAVPTYHVVEATGPSHDRTFTVEVLIDGSPYAEGTAGSKQTAEQRAARKALIRIRQEHPSDPESSPPSETGTKRV